MANNSVDLSVQDVQDLHQIFANLPDADPRKLKVAALLSNSAIPDTMGQAQQKIQSLIPSADQQALSELKSQGMKYPGPDFKPDWAPNGLSPSQYLNAVKSGMSLELPAQMMGGMAVAGPMAALKVAKGAPLAMKILGLAGRSATAGAGMAAGEAAAGGSPENIKTAAVTGAASQPIAEGVTAAAQALAPKIAESALKIGAKDRGRGRTIGNAVLEQTTGIKPSTLHPEIKDALGTLTAQMEDGATAATSAGIVGTAQSAKDVLNDALDNLPRNAKTVEGKLASLKDLFDLGNGVQATYTPTELLELKRGIGMEVASWPAEFQRMEPVKALKTRLYGAIDGELDRIVPGNADINQVISSLIPAKQTTKKIMDSASIPQLIAHRALAHTGAMAGALGGGAYGYRQGGTPGAIAGAAAGMVLPEVAASSGSQMALARILNGLGKQGINPGTLRSLASTIRMQRGSQ